MTQQDFHTDSSQKVAAAVSKGKMNVNFCNYIVFVIF